MMKCPQCKNEVEGEEPCPFCGVTHPREAAEILAKCERNNRAYEAKHPIIYCPYCKSRDTVKIGSGSRLLSFGLSGFGSGKLGKQWHCKHCRSDF